MNIFHKVTLESLKKNKTRTIVTIIGVILSAAMICAVTTSVSSLQNFLVSNYSYDYGFWHGAAYNAGQQELDTIKNSDLVDKIVYGVEIGYARVDSDNDYKPYLFIMGASENFEEMMPVHITAGTYPENRNEIILPAHLLENGGVSHKIGDVLTLEVGQRISDGYSLSQQTSYQGSGEEPETLEIRETRTYTVVGFYERPTFEGYSAPGYTAITVADALTGSERMEVYFSMHKANDVYSFMEEHRMPGTTNHNLLLALGNLQYSGFQAMLFSMAAIIIGLIMFGSVSLIYNAFSISVSERTKQFGLLASIGATKKQLRKMVLFEAFAVSVVGIPIGVLSGIGGISVTLLLIGEKFMTTFDMHFPMRICVSPMSVVVACLVSVVTVLISAWIPSRKAMNVSAVEAIRQSDDIKVKAKEVKTSKVCYKLFGLPGVIASKHFKRNRKKYRATVMSLFMSIVLFISAASFSDYMMSAVRDSRETGTFDLVYMMRENDVISPQELTEAIRKEPTVTQAAYVRSNNLYTKIARKDVTDKWLTEIYGVSAGENRSTVDVSLATIFVEDSVYREYLKRNGLDENLYMNPDKPLAVAIDGFTRMSTVTEKYTKAKVLKNKSTEATAEFLKTVDGYHYCGEYTDKNGELVCRFEDVNNEEKYLEIPKAEAYISIPLSIGTVLYDRPFFMNRFNDLTVLYPLSAIEKIMPNGHANTNYDILMCSSDHMATYSAVKEIVTANGLSGSELYNHAMAVQQDRDLVIILQVFSYGFIVLISLIAVANVFNTISTNVNLRRREFAMLKSVGMSSSGFNKMMNYECLLYGAKALLYGLPVSIGVTYLIYEAVGQGMSTDFRMPWKAMGIAAFSVFAVVFITMLYAMRKIKKDNPIDALKNENL